MGKKKRKFKPQFERDYNFYLNNRDKFTFAGSDISKTYDIQYSEKGKTAKECFHRLDSEGKLLPCCEKELLLELLACKAAINLQIQIWAQSRAEYTLPLIELKEYMEYYQCPDWVLKAVEAQKVKIIRAMIKDGTHKQHAFYYNAIENNFWEILGEMNG